MSDLGTFSMTTAALGGTAVTQAITAFASPSGSTSVQTNAVGASVCAIAFLHYLWMQKSFTSDDNSKVTSLRYSDWFITLPLLLLECMFYSDIHFGDNIHGIITMFVLLMMMLVCGRVAESRSASILYILGFLCLIGVYVLFISMVEEFTTKTLLVLVVMGTWILYGIAGMLLRSSSRWKQVSYNILDLLNKAVFGTVVALLSY